MLTYYLETWSMKFIFNTKYKNQLSIAKIYSKNALPTEQNWQQILQKDKISAKIITGI